MGNRLPEIIGSCLRETSVDFELAQLTCSSLRCPTSTPRFTDHDGKLISLHWTGLNRASLTADGQTLIFPLIPLPNIVSLHWKCRPFQIALYNTSNSRSWELYFQRSPMGSWLFSLEIACISFRENGKPNHIACEFSSSPMLQSCSSLALCRYSNRFVRLLGSCSHQRYYPLASCIFQSHLLSPSGEKMGSW